MPLRIALEDVGNGEGPSPTCALEASREEFADGREENKILDFITIEGKLADALDALCRIGDDAMMEELEDILGKVYNMGRSKPKRRRKK